MSFDLYVWSGPRDLDAAGAAELVRAWEAEGGDPAASPFEASTDVAWFAHELVRDEPRLEVTTDAGPDLSPSRPLVLSTDDPAPARVVGIRLPQGLTVRAFRTIESLGAKYDLVVFDPRSRHLSFPLQEAAEYASATFWPSGAIQATVAGTAGLTAAAVAWIVAIPIVSGIVIVVGGFMALMAAITFVGEGRKRLRKG